MLNLLPCFGQAHKGKPESGRQRERFANKILRYRKSFRGAYLRGVAYLI